VLSSIIIIHFPIFNRTEKEQTYLNRISAPKEYENSNPIVRPMEHVCPPPLRLNAGIAYPLVSCVKPREAAGTASQPERDSRRATEPVVNATDEWLANGCRTTRCHSSYTHPIGAGCCSSRIPRGWSLAVRHLISPPPVCPLYSLVCVNNRFAPLIECGTLRQMLRKESTIGVKEKVLDVLSFLVLSTRLTTRPFETLII